MITRFMLSSFVLFYFLTMSQVVASAASAIIDGEDPSQRRLTRASMTFMPDKQVTETPFVQRQHTLVDKIDTLNVCGVLLCSADDMAGALIRGVTGSEYSHAALCLVDRKGNRYVIESTGTAEQVMAGIRPQVQICTLDTFVRNYNGIVAMRELMFRDRQISLPGSDSLDQGLFKEKIKQSIGAPYEGNFAVLAKAAVGENTMMNSSGGQFCSEYVARVLKALTFLRESVVPDNCVPGDFARDDKLQFSFGCALSQLIMLRSAKVSCCRC